MTKNIRNKLLIIVFILLMICGCNKDKSDAIKFKEEFESFNEQYEVLNIKEENPFKYRTQSEIENLINNKETFVVLYGKSDNNDTRNIIEPLIDSSNNNALGTIYYVDSSDNIPLLIGYIKGEKYNETNSLDNINDIISKISIELSTCNIEVGC